MMEHDHPIIENMERTGYPDGKTPLVPVCPICHTQCETVYTNHQQEIVGCDNCLNAHDAWDVKEIQGPDPEN